MTDEQVTVTRIVDDHVKSGYSEKTKKEWTMSRVELSNGETTNIFNPISIGDVVEARENSGYKNWSRVNATKAAANAQHDEIMNALRLIMAQIKALQAASGVKAVPNTALPQNTAVGGATQPTGPAIARSVLDEYRQQQDPVYPVDDTKDIDLNDIPF